MASDVDRAVAEQLAGLERYLLEDGGVDEGPTYWSVTLHAVLPTLVAWARRRGRSVSDLLSAKVRRSAAYVAAFSTTKPGAVLREGDATSDRYHGDSIAMLAGLLSEEPVYLALAGAHTLRPETAGYLNEYICEGVFALLLGPATLALPTGVVPEYVQLPDTGLILQTAVGSPQRRDGATS